VMRDAASCAMWDSRISRVSKRLFRERCRKTKKLLNPSLAFSVSPRHEAPPKGPFADLQQPQDFQRTQGLPQGSSAHAEVSISSLSDGSLSRV
jgi:hypothetical protein